MLIDEVIHLKTGDVVQVTKSGKLYQLISDHAHIVTTDGRVGNFRQLRDGKLWGVSFMLLKPANVTFYK